MKKRLFTLLACAVSLVACGGGSGSPSPSQTPGSYRPAINGDAYTYAGTTTTSFVRAPVTIVPAPSPNPSFGQTTTASVAQNVAVSGATFDTIAGLYDFATRETDTAPLKTSTSKSDAYYAYVASGTSTFVELVGSTETTSDGVQTQTVENSGNGLVDVLPETTGAILPANNAALTTNETDPDGQTTTRTVKADGSYTETSNFPDGSSSTAVENSDGSANYSFPLAGLASAGSNTTFVVGPVASTSPGTLIPITLNVPAALSNTGKAAELDFSVAVWYPQAPPILSNETYVDDGPAAIPASCNVASSYASPSRRLTQTVVRVDTIFGELETWQNTTYTVAEVGVACVQLSDTTQQYYDFSGQTHVPIATSSTPLQTSTVSETVGLTGATLDALAASRSALSATAARSAAAQEATAGFRALVERNRTMRHTGFLRRLMRVGPRRV
ncbi:MAG: hypothetical protein ACLPSH_13390 [Vulcanimicrobiaceae bacterium]